METLLEELGINWKLLASQAVNFLILLVVLRLFVYKPVLDVIKKRKAKIEEGLAKSEEASIRLKDVDNICKENLKQAEKESIAMVGSAEARAKQREQEMIKKAESYQKELFEKAEIMLKKQKEEAKDAIFKDAADVVKRVIARTVELDPDKIDEALIRKAASEVKNSN